MGEVRPAGADGGAARELAEHDFRTAMAVAREQGANQFVLAAAISHARLLSQTGRAEEARRLVQAARAPLTEGRRLQLIAESEAIVAGAPLRAPGRRHA